MIFEISGRKRSRITHQNANSILSIKSCCPEMRIPRTEVFNLFVGVEYSSGISKGSSPVARGTLFTYAQES